MGHVLSPEAEQDLDSIWFYIATQSGAADTADRFIDSLVERILLLARHPHLGRDRQSDLGRPVRSFPVGEYVIFYRIHEEDVHVLRVLRGSRDLETLI